MIFFVPLRFHFPGQTHIIQPSLHTKPRIKIRGYNLFRSDGSIMAKQLRSVGSEQFLGMEFIPSKLVVVIEYSLLPRHTFLFPSRNRNTKNTSTTTFERRNLTISHIIS